MSEEAAQDYGRVKFALMRRYDLTEDGYRCKFRASKLEVDENPEQFIVRLETYLLRWLKLSNTERSFEGLKDLVVKEQFKVSCPKDLGIHLRERDPETLVQIAKIADQYKEAHEKHLFSSASSKSKVHPNVDETKNLQNVNLVATRLLTAHPRLGNVTCVASKGMRLKTAVQVNRSREDKIKMVCLCSM